MSGDGENAHDPPDLFVLENRAPDVTPRHELSYASPQRDATRRRYDSRIWGMLATLLGIFATGLLVIGCGLVTEGREFGESLKMTRGLLALIFAALLAAPAIWWWGRFMIRRYSPLDTRRRG
jgi:hypothetical protein